MCYVSVSSANVGMGADATDTAEPDRGGELDGDEKRPSHRQCGVQRQQETSAGATSVAPQDAHCLQVFKFHRRKPFILL